MLLAACLSVLLSSPDPDLPTRLADPQATPGPQPDAPADDRRPPAEDAKDHSHDSWVTISAAGRAAFPLGAMRVGTVSGSTTVKGSRMSYDDLFDVGWGADVEVSFLIVTWNDRDEKDDKDHHHRARPQALGFYASAQWDRFEGDGATLPDGSTIEPDHMTVMSFFGGFKHHLPWGRHFYHELRLGGGAVHYSAVDASLSSGGNARLFRNTWGVAAELGLRLGANLGGFSVFVAGVARAAEGPTQGEGLTFSSTSSTFFTAAAEAGLEIQF